MSFTCILAAHRFVFEGCARRSRGLCTRAPAAPASISVPTPSFLCLPFPLPPCRHSLAHSFSLSRPSWRFPPISSPSARPAAVPGCRLPSSVSPASHRPVMSCLPPLASSPAPRHNLPQTLKRSGCFARRSHSTSSGENTVSSHPAIAELHYHNSRARGVFGVARKSRRVAFIYI